VSNGVQAWSPHSYVSKRGFRLGERGTIGFKGWLHYRHGCSPMKKHKHSCDRVGRTALFATHNDSVSTILPSPDTHRGDGLLFSILVLLECGYNIHRDDDIYSHNRCCTAAEGKEGAERRSIAAAVERGDVL
jgi:hypothetical protein